MVTAYNYEHMKNVILRSIVVLVLEQLDILGDSDCNFKQQF